MAVPVQLKAGQDVVAFTAGGRRFLLQQMAFDIADQVAEVNRALDLSERREHVAANLLER